MGDLKDYSGEFDPELKFTDFSCEMLARAWEATSRLYLLLDGIWYDIIKARYGEPVAWDIEREVWGPRFWPTDIDWMAKAFHIQGDDVATVFKSLQIDPLIGVIYDTEFELKNRNHGIFTIPKCRTLEYFERHNETEKIDQVCIEDAVDHKGFQAVADHFNPRIKVRPLKLPPRQSQAEVACQWEFKLEQ